jgi:hypothetical protein
MVSHHNPALTGSLGTPARHLSALTRQHRPRRQAVYQITDRLHTGRRALVPGTEISATVSAWLAELGAHSPMADDLAHAVHAGDWPTAHSVSDQLSLDVAVAA